MIQFSLSKKAKALLATALTVVGTSAAFTTLSSLFTASSAIACDVNLDRSCEPTPPKPPEPPVDTPSPGSPEPTYVYDCFFGVDRANFRDLGNGFAEITNPRVYYGTDYDPNKKENLEPSGTISNGVDDADGFRLVDRVADNRVNGLRFKGTFLISKSEFDLSMSDSVTGELEMAVRLLIHPKHNESVTQNACNKAAAELLKKWQVPAPGDRGDAADTLNPVLARLPGLRVTTV